MNSIRKAYVFKCKCGCRTWWASTRFGRAGYFTHARALEHALEVQYV